MLQALVVNASSSITILLLLVLLTVSQILQDFTMKLNVTL